MNYSVTDSTAWSQWVTPRSVKDRPVHGWLVFPHSFTDELVHALIREWRLGGADTILDPFVGAGTSLLASQEMEVPAVGIDISPLAVFVSNTKVATHCPIELTKIWGSLERAVRDSESSWDASETHYPQLVRDALPDGRLDRFHGILECLRVAACTTAERDFFRLALVSLVPEFSQAVANGGWLRWLNSGRRGEELVDAFASRVELALTDLGNRSRPRKGSWRADIGDARKLPVADDQVSAVITSPPYPNRHDYTRVFGVELLLCFLDWQQNRALRYQSFHSHPEARPERPECDGYRAPDGLEECIAAVDDQRLQRMLAGYFLDMYLCLGEMSRVSKKGARIGLVVGNAQYSGKPLMVDEFTAQLGERVGLTCSEIRVLRWRGNSAQQMDKFGRRPSRESIVMFVKE